MSVRGIPHQNLKLVFAILHKRRHVHAERRVAALVRHVRCFLPVDEHLCAEIDAL